MAIVTTKLLDALAREQFVHGYVRPCWDTEEGGEGEGVRSEGEEVCLLLEVVRNSTIVDLEERKMNMENKLHSFEYLNDVTVCKVAMFYINFNT